jgi:hypothetical protein
VSVYTANGSLKHEAENAYLLTDGSLTITCSDTSGSYILKWTQIPTDYSGVPHLEKY